MPIRKNEEIDKDYIENLFKSADSWKFLKKIVEN